VSAGADAAGLDGLADDEPLYRSGRHTLQVPPAPQCLQALQLRQAEQKAPSEQRPASAWELKQQSTRTTRMYFIAIIVTEL